jgi:hypothetical protein
MTRKISSILSEDMDWIHLAQEGVLWPADVNPIMNILAA